MPGLRTDPTASVVICGHAFIQNLRRGHYQLGTTPDASIYLWRQHLPDSPKSSDGDHTDPENAPADLLTQQSLEVSAEAVDHEGVAEEVE